MNKTPPPSEIQTRRLTFGYEKDSPVLRELSLVFPAGSRTAIMGASGCGKTTLLRLIAGLEKPWEGEILNPAATGMVFQEHRLFKQITAADNVAAVLAKPERDKAHSFLELVGMADFADKYPGELSGGQLRRVSLARALAYDAGNLLLDEPFAGLDDTATGEMLEIILNAAAERTVLLVTHDESLARAFAPERVITLAGNS